MFRRDGSGPRTRTVRKVRLPDGGAGWQRITDPPEGIRIEAADVFITGAELDRCEDHIAIHAASREYGGSVPAGQAAPEVEAAAG